MERRNLISTALGCSLLALACSPPEPVDQRVTGELTGSDQLYEGDNSRFDDHSLEAGENWTVTIDMTSEQLDPYLWLLGPNGGSLVQDDDGGEGTNSRIVYQTTERGTYTVRANAYCGGNPPRCEGEQGLGAYELHIVARPTASQ